MAQAETSIAESADELRRSLEGDVVVPGDVQYDAARLCFNAFVDRPAAIARCQAVLVLDESLEPVVVVFPCVSGSENGHPMLDALRALPGLVEDGVRSHSFVALDIATGCER